MRTPPAIANWSPLLVWVAVCYALLTAAAYLFQERMLYFPDMVSRSRVAQMAAQRGLSLWPDDDGDYYGLVSVNPPREPRGTVLIWHGNAGSALHRAHYVGPLQGLGYRVVLLEYPGYGGRSGSLGERSFVADALQAARQAADDFGGPMYAWGESLGCGVASAVAADRKLEVQGAAMITPWDRLPDLAQRLYWYLPARWLVRDRYDNIRNLSEFDGPVAVLMAERDEIIPRAHTMRLYESLPGDKRLWVFDGAGHNTWPTASRAQWWAEVMAYLSGAGGKTEQTAH